MIILALDILTENTESYIWVEKAYSIILNSLSQVK